MSLMASFYAVLFPRDDLDEIWDLIESVSEGFSFLLLNILAEEGICTEDAECNLKGDIEIFFFEKLV